MNRKTVILLVSVVLFNKNLCDQHVNNAKEGLVEELLGHWTLQILHTNDMHAKFEEVNENLNTCTQKDKNELKCYGGFGRIAYVVRTSKQLPFPTLFLNAGDTFQGSLWYYLHTWKIVSNMLNILNPDVVTLGNHEFDNGIEGLLPFLKNASFPIVVSNLDLSREPEMAAIIKKSIVLNLNGRKIGIIGYITSEPGVMPRTRNVIIKDEIESIRNEINRLKKEENVNIFIGLGHSGYEVDKKIATEVDGLDLIVGGHSHSFLSNKIQQGKEKPEGPYPTYVTQKSGKIVYIVQAYESTKYIGRLFVKFDNNGNIIGIQGNPMILNFEVPQASDVLQELEQYRTNVDEFKNKLAGYSRVYLMGRGKVCRGQECNLGNLITDSLIQYNLEQYTAHEGWTDAAIAVLNSGSIRSSVNKVSGDPITYNDIIHILSPRNVAGKTKLTGQQILAMLEHSIAKHEPSWTNISYTGQFLQLSGLQVAYNLTQPVGSRVLYSNEVFVRCARCWIPKYYKLRLNKVYTVIMPLYLYNGGNGYTMLKTENSTWTSLGTPIYEVLARYLEKTNYPIHVASENRIKFYPPLIEESDLLSDEPL